MVRPLASFLHHHEHEAIAGKLGQFYARTIPGIIMTAAQARALVRQIKRTAQQPPAQQRETHPPPLRHCIVPAQ
jgi:hypothetical protein